MRQPPMSHNLLNRCCHFAYCDATMWLKCVRHLKNAIFMQTFAMCATLVTLEKWFAQDEKCAGGQFLHKEYQYSVKLQSKTLSILLLTCHLITAITIIWQLDSHITSACLKCEENIGNFCSLDMVNNNIKPKLFSVPPHHKLGKVLKGH